MSSGRSRTMTSTNHASARTSPGMLFVRVSLRLMDTTQHPCIRERRIFSPAPQSWYARGNRSKDPPGSCY